MTAALQALSSIAPYRAIFWKETAAGQNRITYFFAKNFSRIMTTLLAPAVFSLLLYSAIFPYTSLFDMWTMFLALQWSAEGMGYLIAITMGESGQIGCIILVLVTTMTGGGYPPLKTMHGALRSASNFSIQRWAMEVPLTFLQYPNTTLTLILSI